MRAWGCTHDDTNQNRRNWLLMRTVRLFQISYHQWAQAAASSERESRPNRWPGRMTWATVRRNACWIMSRPAVAVVFRGWRADKPLLLMAARNIRATTAHQRAHRVNTLTARDDVFITCNRGNVTATDAGGFYYYYYYHYRLEASAHSGLFSLDTAACSSSVIDGWLTPRRGLI